MGIEDYFDKYCDLDTGGDFDIIYRKDFITAIEEYTKELKNKIWEEIVYDTDAGIFSMSNIYHLINNATTLGNGVVDMED